MSRYYWRIKILDAIKWSPERRSWVVGDVPVLGRSIEYGDSPIRDRKSRNEMIALLAAANINITVERLKV